jgi:hypothetical protein
MGIARLIPRLIPLIRCTFFGPIMLDVTRTSWYFVGSDRQLSGQEDQRIRRRETRQGILWI